MGRFIISAALTGAIHTPSMSPYLPITPDELAEEARRSRESGAAVVHVHARDPETGIPTSDSAVFGESQMRCGHLHHYRRQCRHDGRRT